jgi:hypothetical protein
MENWERIRSGQSTIGWAELDQFVVDYGWLNLSFRYAIARPCWMLHPDVVEIVAMIYGGRKAYEAEREGMTMRGHADYLAALKDLIDAIENVFRVHGGDNCDVEKAEDGSWHALHTEVGWRWGDEERQPVNSWVGFPIPPSPLHAVASESAARRERSEDDELDAALRLSEEENVSRRPSTRPARGTTLGR